MKVYICTSGSFSDYGIVAIFSTRELAERYAADMPDANDVEEYEVDAEVGLAYGPRWAAAIIKDDGSLRVQPVTAPKHRHPERCAIFDDEHYFIVVSPVSAEHAKKVAVETRQEWLRGRAAAEIGISAGGVGELAGFDEGH